MEKNEDKCNYFLCILCNVCLSIDQTFSSSLLRLIEFNILNILLCIFLVLLRFVWLSRSMFLLLNFAFAKRKQLINLFQYGIEISRATNDFELELSFSVKTTAKDNCILHFFPLASVFVLSSNALTMTRARANARRFESVQLFVTKICIQLKWCWRTNDNSAFCYDIVARRSSRPNPIDVISDRAQPTIDSNQKLTSILFCFRHFCLVLFAASFKSELQILSGVSKCSCKVAK